jgi:hypothetical protein
MASFVLHTPMIHSVRRISAPGTFPVFTPGDGVQFGVAGGLVRGRVVGIDAQARRNLPLGAPYRLSVFEAPPNSGYSAGTDCTIRAACLELDPTAPEYERSLAAASTVVIEPRRLAARPSVPTFLVAFMREGGNYPIQGTLLVQGETLDAANAAATTYLNAELQTDVSEGRELPDAMVMLLNASEVPTADVGISVVASVSW